MESTAAEEQPPAPEEQPGQSDAAQAEQQAVQAFLQETNAPEEPEAVIVTETTAPVPSTDQAIPPQQGESATPDA